MQWIHDGVTVGVSVTTMRTAQRPVTACGAAQSNRRWPAGGHVLQSSRTAGHAGSHLHTVLFSTQIPTFLRGDNLSPQVKLLEGKLHFLITCHKEIPKNSTLTQTARPYRLRLSDAERDLLKVIH